MDFRLLGPLEVAEPDRKMALGGVRQRSVLAILLLHVNEVVSTDRLIDELWGASAPDTAAKALQVNVSRIRRAIGPGKLMTQAPGYVLQLDRSEYDLGRFEQLVAEAGRSAPETEAAKLREALALWRGPALADLASHLRSRKSLASRSCACRSLGNGSTPISTPAATPNSWGNSRRSWPVTRCGSAFDTS